MVMTQRPDDAPRLSPGLLRYARDHGVRVQLDGLSTPEVRELGTALGHGVLSRRSAERLRDHTGGSPVHLRALLEEVAVEELHGTAGVLPPPPSFARLVRAATIGCSDATRQLLNAAAVLGMQCPLREVAAVAQLGDPLQLLEEALLTQLVEARSDNAGGWLVAFKHPLIRSAMYHDVGPASLQRLHARAALVVGEPERLAHRVTAAGDEPDSELVPLLLEQEREEMRRARPVSAADRLLAAARLSPPGNEQDLLLLRAVGLLLDAGEASEAAAFGARISATPDTTRRRIVQARLAWMAGRHDEAEALAGSIWKDAAAIERVAAAAVLAQIRILRDDSGGAVRLATQALAGGPSSPAQSSEIRGIQAIASAFGGQAGESLRLLEDLAQAPSAVPVERHPELSARGMIRMITDDLPGGRADLRECASVRRGWAPSPRALVALGGLAEAEYRCGAWDDSLTRARRAIALVTDTGQAWLCALVHATAVFVLAGRGMWEEAEAHVRAATEAANALSDQASIACAADAAVHLASCRGDAAGVVAAAERLWSAPPGAAREPGLFGWEGQYAAALVALGHLDEAEAVLVVLASLAERRGRRSTMAVVARVRGELNAARGALPAALDAFEAAVTIGCGAASVLDQALAQAAYGRSLRRAGRRRAAGERLRMAQVVLAGLGARPFLARCNSELAACGLAIDGSAGRSGVRLTTQEQAVSTLVCSGRTNREVAAELVLRQDHRIPPRQRLPQARRLLPHPAGCAPQWEPTPAR